MVLDDSSMKKIHLFSRNVVGEQRLEAEIYYVGYYFVKTIA